MSLEVHDVFSQAIPGAFGMPFLRRLLELTNTPTPHHTAMNTPELFTIQIKAPSLTAVTQKAMQTWTDALRQRVQFSIVKAGASPRKPDITIGWGATDRSRSPDRIAQCASRVERDADGTQIRRHTILLDTRVKWQITGWQRFWGIGDENALAAIIHELGHALGFPHSNVYSDVMHDRLGSTVIDDHEASLLCNFWDIHNS